jgi:hypothetical protein
MYLLYCIKDIVSGLPLSFLEQKRHGPIGNKISPCGPKGIIQLNEVSPFFRAELSHAHQMPILKVKNQAEVLI